MLTKKDFALNNADTLNKVKDTIINTNSKRELAKCIYYCAGWGEYELSNMIHQRIDKLGLTTQHIEHYLPKSYENL